MERQTKFQVRGIVGRPRLLWSQRALRGQYEGTDREMLY